MSLCELARYNKEKPKETSNLNKNEHQHVFNVIARVSILFTGSYSCTNSCCYLFIIPGIGTVNIFAITRVYICVNIHGHWTGFIFHVCIWEV